MDDLREHMLSKPDSNFVAFTHNYGKWFTPDYIIRKFMVRVPKYRRRGLKIDETFSHTGNIWAEEGKLWYWHQTWPRFKKEEWSFRPYTVIFEVDDPKKVKFARKKSRELHEKGRGYSILGLITFAFTIWAPWIRNPVKVGKVCSGAVAAMYPDIVTGKPYHDIDPQYAHDKFEKYGAKRWLISK